MLLDFGKKFTDQWGSVNQDAMRAHWARGFAGYTGREIKRGVLAAKELDWPPSLPQFLKLCRPPLDPLVAYHEAVAGLEARGKGEAGDWSHPGVYWAAMLLRVDLLGQTYALVKARWTSALDAQMERTEWAEIPPPRQMLPPPAPSPAARELAGKMMAELGASGVIKTDDPKFDHLRWARRLVEREGRGEKLEIAQIKLARAALARRAES